MVDWLFPPVLSSDFFTYLFRPILTTLFEWSSFAGRTYAYSKTTATLDVISAYSLGRSPVSFIHTSVSHSATRSLALCLAVWHWLVPTPRDAIALSCDATRQMLQAGRTFLDNSWSDVIRNSDICSERLPVATLSRRVNAIQHYTTPK